MSSEFRASEQQLYTPELYPCVSAIAQPARINSLTTGFGGAAVIRLALLHPLHRRFTNGIDFQRAKLGNSRESRRSYSSVCNVREENKRFSLSYIKVNARLASSTYSLKRERRLSISDFHFSPHMHYASREPHHCISISAAAVAA